MSDHDKTGYDDGGDGFIEERLLELIEAEQEPRVSTIIEQFLGAHDDARPSDVRTAMMRLLYSGIVVVGDDWVLSRVVDDALTTGYDGDFYAAYELYLREPRVRSKHDRILQMWQRYSQYNALNVIDLGCGRSREYLRFSPVALYRGFDLQAHVDNFSEVADYRSPDFLTRVRALGWTPKVFVSLFSSECTATPEENTKFYEGLFRAFPTIQHGLVSGFYYAGRRGTNPIEEAGGIISWQTVSSIEDDVSDVYDEVRISTRVPSDMFGEDVVEVWRMLSRRCAEQEYEDE